MKIFVTIIAVFTFNFALADSKALEKFDSLLHENKGCPVNSICSKASGELLIKWEKNIEKINQKNKVNLLNNFKVKHGIPIQFLTSMKGKKALDPIMWNSRCKKHNPRNPNNDIYRGIKFFKSLPKSDLTVLTPIRVYDGNKKLDFTIPYQDQVYFIKNNQLVILKEFNDFFYQISVDQNGKISIVNHPSSLINLALDKKVSDQQCPDQLEFKEVYFSKTYCQKVLDLDTNDLKLIQYAWSCP